MICLMILLTLAGCETLSGKPQPRSVEENQLFGAVSMKLDTFSKIKDLAGTGKPDGIEALIEFDDRFGDRTKASGKIFFELFGYRPGWPDPRGERIVNPWSASLANYDEQKAHWERASGAYAFRLACDQLAWNQNYVLTATFESSSGQRFFTQIVLKSTPNSP